MPTASNFETFRRFAARVKASVEADLAAAFGRSMASLGATEGLVVGAGRDLVLRGGKRLRAAVCAAGYVASGATLSAGDAGDLDPIRPALVALELHQGYLLAHDDWMDDDATRRGGPSVHAALAAAYGDARSGGVGAILAGDWLHAATWGELAACRVEPRSLARALAAFAVADRDVVAGQIRDVRASPRGLDDVLEMHRLKTGSYTTRGPLLVGAALGGANDDLLARLSAYADPLGVAFQLRDDLLGAFGSPETTGKPADGDLRAAKATAVVALLRARASSAVARTLDEPPLDADAVAAAVNEAKRLGIPAEIEAMIATYADEAARAVDHTAVGNDARALLLGAIDALVGRDA